MTEWQPIETAPKDGTWVLIHYNDNCVPKITFWNNSAGFDDWAHSDEWGTNTPIHWMPLPEPPQ